MVAQQFVNTMCTYGMGGSCSARLAGSSVLGRTARDLLVEVSRLPQDNQIAQRTARNLQRLLASGRPFDVEVTRRSNGTSTEPEYVLPEDAPLDPNDARLPTVDTVDLRVSEHYVGGTDSAGVHRP